MTKKFSQDPMTTKELYDYLTAFMTKEVEDEKAARRIKMLARRTVTLSDVVVIVSALTEHQTEAIAQLIDKLQVQERVIRKLQADENMFIEAEEEYLATLRKREEEFKANLEIAAQSGKTEAEEAKIEAVEEEKSPVHHVLNLLDDVNMLGE